MVALHPGTRVRFVMLTLDGDTLEIETRTLSARMRRGVLTSLHAAGGGPGIIGAVDAGSAALELVFAGGEAVPLGHTAGDRTGCRILSDRRAVFRVESWHGDGVIAVSEDPATGDLVVEPSGYSSRPGLRAVRWNLPGIAGGLDLVAPLFQGVRLPLEDAHLRDTRWTWPHSWEAGLFILQGARGGAWVHCRDTRYRYKTLRIGSADEARRISLETEGWGPPERSLAAGGLEWRLNVHTGDWRRPASTYRDWLLTAFGASSRGRPRWIDELELALSWCPCDGGILDALAARRDPRRVLLHVPGWRRAPYDEGYPDYTAGETGRAFITRARELGYRVLPHFNAIDMDPTHPAYHHVRDFQYREIETRRLQGWTWVDGRSLPLQESNAARLRHRDKKTMVKIHPGLSQWRSILAQTVQSAVEALALESVFLDVTLCTWNLDNCLVEDCTPTEGMKRLLETVAGLGRGLAVGGEGRNEITALDQCLSQVHLFRSWQTSVEGLERAGGCPLGEYLLGGLSRSFGYSGLGGATEHDRLRMRVHAGLGAIPTLTVRTAEEIESPNPAVERILAGGEP